MVKGKNPQMRAPRSGMPIVGIGASAGGLEAFTKFLSALPPDTGMAFVLIQHLDPHHDSMSAEILSRTTKMKVTEVKDGMKLEPNCVCIIPSGFSMGILNGVLNLLPRTEDRRQHLVIDFFLKSLAADQKNLAIGVVLSGTGSDGTLGLSEIKSEGGITFAQTPSSAKFEQMPQNAIASGNVDFILTPEKIAHELARVAQHPYVQSIPSPTTPLVEDDEPLTPHDSLNHIFLLLRNQCHVDFSFYKLNTVKRRIERRMLLHKVESLKEYVQFLTDKPNEVKALYADILIHVTGFFRDAEAFQELANHVFPRLLKNRKPGAPIRIWVPGCSTGEEVYSIAIALLEFLGDKVSHTPIQIFATDISEHAIQKARLGQYSENISSTVSKERLSRFFTKHDGFGDGYKIVKSIRDICIFSRHDVTTDPPFARIDLISCRNLLIYFSPKLQKHVIPIFHYSLVPDGLLWLGKSETISGSPELFSLINKTHKIFSRNDAPISVNLRFPSSTYVHGSQVIESDDTTASTNVTVDVQKIAEQTLQSEYPGVLVNEDMEILQVRGRTSPMIELRPGVPSFNLVKTTHPELLRDLRTTIQDAKKLNRAIRRDALSIGKGRSLKTFNLNVIPVAPSEKSKRRLYLILFENIAADPQNNPKKKAAAGLKNRKVAGQRDPEMLAIRQELAELQEYQHDITQKFESAQEDLTAANEELQSANEELQSTNEELETAKEELQSGNEELTTVNDELQTRSLEQSQTNNDLINLLGSVEIPIVMLGPDQRVRRFTPLAGQALNLIATDVGRPISDLKLHFTSPSGDIVLENMISATLETLNAQEVEVQDRKGHWFRLQVRPYKTIDNKIDGSVIALVDIHNLKLSLGEVKDAKSEVEKANRAKDLFLATLSHELRTPLTAILSWAQLLRSGKLDEEKSKRAVETIEESGKIQAQLINDLLDVSRIVSGKLALETTELDPASVILAAVEAIRPLAEAKSIQIQTFIASKVGTVMADPVRLQQVFWNLLTNAVKFSAPDSKISVKLESTISKDGEKAKAMIKVEDSGKGIDPSFLPQIFDRFSQQDSSSIRVHGGLGLGLAIVRDLVQLHGGTIQAESLGENRGACFTVVLPIKSDQKLESDRIAPVEQPQNPVSNKTLPTRLAGVRVLIVDDDPSPRDAFSEILGTMGAEVMAASSAKDGFRIFGQFRPHVLISDIAMPGEDGYSLIKKIRALAQVDGGRTPALAMTAYAGEDDARRALQAGFQVHLSKPVDGEHLAKTVAKLASAGL